MKSTSKERLRVALIAGTLGRGGAEKQLLYFCRALIGLGAEVRVYSLTRGEYYEPLLKELGVPVVWIGAHPSPLVRLFRLWRAVQPFSPHILQSIHFYTNLYSSLVARLCGALGIGSLRSDVNLEYQSNGLWRGWLLRTPPTLIANSQAARSNAIRYGLPGERVWVVPNVIDLADFDNQAARPADDVRPACAKGEVAPAAVLIGRLEPAKRVDRFLRALALARQQVPPLQGWVIGRGVLRQPLEELADELGLLPGGVQFLGTRSDVPALLRAADILCLTSDHEGFPNVLLEGMAAGLPVIATPAGDAARVVEDRVSGYIVSLDSDTEIAARLVELANSSEHRAAMGKAGRQRVEQFYSFEQLAPRLLETYRQIAAKRRLRRLLEILSAGL